jgi:hypothetical protein
LEFSLSDIINKIVDIVSTQAQYWVGSGHGLVFSDVEAHFPPNGGKWVPGKWAQKQKILGGGGYTKVFSDVEAALMASLSIRGIACSSLRPHTLVAQGHIH